MESQELIHQAILTLQNHGVLGKSVSRSGDNLIFNCPFPENHGGRTSQKTASFGIRVDNGKWHCFSCKEGGKSIYSLYASLMKVEEDEALDILGQPVIPYQAVEQALQGLKSPVLSSPSPMGPYPMNLVGIQSHKEAAAYLHSRAIPEEIWHRAKLSFCPDARMPEVLTSKGPSRGVPGRRIVFPLSWEGKVVGYSGRAIDKVSAIKYYRPVNNINQMVYNPMGYSPEGTKTIFVVEGEIDALASIREGLPTVSTFGADISYAQATWLNQFDLVVFLYDPDDAGRKGLDRFRERYAGFFPRHRVFWLPQGKDPGSMSLGWGKTIEGMLLTPATDKTLDNLLKYLEG